MSTVEAAASLFGSSDSGPDFFAVPEEGDSASDPPTSATNGSSLFSGQDSSSLFDSVTGESEAYSLPSAQGYTEHNAFTGTQTLGSDVFSPHGNGANDAYEYGSDAQTGYEYGSENYSGYDAHGWYDEHGQWHGYEQYDSTNNQDYTPTPSDSYAHSSSTDSYANNYSNSPYTANTTESSSAYDPASSFYVPPSSSKQTTYDPYRPAVPPVQPLENLHAGATSTSSYGSYNPSGAGAAQTASTPSYSGVTTSAYNPYAPVGTESSTSPYVSGNMIPAPTTSQPLKPPVSPYRPSTFNAYDPPLPAVKAKRAATIPVNFSSRSPYDSHGPVSPPPSTLLVSRSSVPSQNAATSSPSGPPPPPRSSTLDSYKPAGAAVHTLASPPKGTPFRSSPDPVSAFSHHRPSGASVQGPYASFTNSQHNGPHSSLPTESFGVPNNEVLHAGRHPELSPYGHSPENHEVSQVYGIAESRADVQTSAWQEQNDAFLTKGEAEGAVAAGYHETADTKHFSKPSSPQPFSSPNRSLRGISPPGTRTSIPTDSHLFSGEVGRAASPLSDSGRSHTGSLGRKSPSYARNGSGKAQQSFSSLDEQVSRHGEPFNHIMRGPLERVGSPSARSVGSGGGYAVPRATLSSTTFANQDQNVVDLASDTSSVYGQSSSPVLSASRNRDMNTFTSSENPTAAPPAEVYDPYKPRQDTHPFRTAPSETPLPVSNMYMPSDQYMPQHGSFGHPPTRERSMSNTSSFSSSSAALHDPYAPAQMTRRQVPPPIGYGGNYDVSPAPPVYDAFAHTATLGRSSLEVSYSPPPVSGPYAPSPSLLGTNDPLGRASAKVPIVSFGFGGKFVTCFHTSPTLDTGFDVALSSRKCTDVHMRILHKLIPESALDVSATAYPGPLFGDPGTPVTALVRTTVSSSTKTKAKKTKVVAYLTERAEEIERGLGYLTSGGIDRRRADGKLALVRLLQVMVEYDGQLHGSPAAENAARTAVLPRLASTQDATGSSAFLNAPTGASLASGGLGLTGSDEKPLAQYAVRPSVLGTLQDFLLRGEKRKAYHYALDEKLWAHAMVISSSMDKDAFKEVVNEFIRTELGVKPGARANVPVTNGHESLRLAYSIYSGQSSAAVQHLFPTKSLQAGPTSLLQPPTPMNLMTPLSPNFPPPSLAANIPPEILSQWQEYAVMLFSGQMGAESSSALTTLGDYLLSNDWIEAAHCCYLLSPQSSPIGGVGAPSVRIVLVGSQSPQRNSAFLRDPDSLIFSEIAEFALSLHAPSKGQEAFMGFPHLQAYRLVRALQLAEMGHIPIAKRYCEAINNSAFRPSPYLSQLFSDQLKEFSNRIAGNPELDKGNSWIGGKISKPSLDSIGDWLGGTLSKFVAGEAESSSPVTGESHPALNNPAYAGAFSHYSAISSTNTSRGPSPAPSFVNSFVNTTAMSNGPPGRSGSAMAVKTLTNSYAPVNRSSSAMDYSRPESRKNTPPPRVASADAGTTSFAQSQSFSQAMTGYGYGNNGSLDHATNGFASHSESVEQHQQESGWWSSAYGDSSVTPTATTFFKVNEQANVNEHGPGFISLMDDHNMTPSPLVATTFAASGGKVTGMNDDLEDDLGLGNNNSKKRPESTEGGEDRKSAEIGNEDSKKPDAKPSLSTSSSGSWLGRWFGRSASASSPGPVKANLGEETTFYYDKDLKRWVNKKSGAETPKSTAPPPPPSRAQTVSPSRSMSMSHSGPPPPSPLPPGRPQSAMDSTSAPPPRKPIMRVRSNLIPEESASTSAPPTPAVMSSLSAPPPTGRPRSAAAKKSVRSRYVDVFQQENS
ncbi:hypothetical protein M0805_006834 [Coniferiporia weirii]|nr:hypothetical protein M0805_006834 [Coniferiporia weirii]